MGNEPKGKQDGARANREGKPWQRADGRWTARVYPPEEGAKPRYVYGKTRAEAKTAKEKLERELETSSGDARKNITIEAYLTDHWIAKTLAQRVAARRLAPSTLDSYRDTVSLHIIPALGTIRLQALSVSQVRAWQHALLTKPSGRQRRRLRKGERKLPKPVKLTPRTVAICHGVLRKAINDAIRDGEWGLRDNVVTRVDPPTPEEKEIEPPTMSELGLLLEAASKDALWCYWLVVLGLGLRRGEGLGLRWEDIDFESATVRLALSIQRRRGEISEKTGRRQGQLVATGLKTRKSRAVMAAPASVMEALKVHQKDQRRIRMQAPVWNPSGLVFTTSIGTAIEPRNINARWAKVCDTAGVRRIRVHDLRHAFATYLAAEGVHPKAIQTVLRHSRLATTDIYMHAVEEIGRETAGTMDKILTRVRQPAADRARKKSS